MLGKKKLSVLFYRCNARLHKFEYDILDNILLL
jgi:hypothetical protein